MQSLVSSRRSVLLGVLFAPFLMLVIYGSAYLALVQREPYYSSLGNIKRALAEYELKHNLGNQPHAPVLPDVYLPKYAIAARGIETFFAPIHELDRLVRPGIGPGAVVAITAKNTKAA